MVAMAMGEPEEGEFNRLIASEGVIVGAPTLVELHLVLVGSIDGLLAKRNIVSMPFDLHHYRVAATAFERYGKGRGHRAQLNFGDCMAYAVAKTHSVPLLYKGSDFDHTDIRSALK
jgi:ribonuclease VapC